MDGVTLKKLHAEVLTAAKWLKRDDIDPTRSEPVGFFGVGIVAERHQLSRDQVDELLKHMQSELNRAIQRREGEEFWADVFSRCYTGTN